jgi:hypothetical protein
MKANRGENNQQQNQPACKSISRGMAASYQKQKWRRSVSGGGVMNEAAAIGAIGA